jgi:ferric-dicitrate binding protein FerR (iron transport regulator)
MTKTKTKRAQAKSALPYLQRLLEDQAVHDQLRNAAGGVREAYSRARARGDKAVDDKRLYGNLRQAAVSVRDAALAVQGPKPRSKRRVRKAAKIGLAVGACAWLTARLQQLQAQQKRTAGGADDGTAG